MMKIYTRSGDQGSTSLLGNIRVAKCDLRIRAFGTVDELNAVLGVAISPEDTLARIESRDHHISFGAKLYFCKSLFGGGIVYHEHQFCWRFGGELCDYPTRDYDAAFGTVVAD